MSQGIAQVWSDPKVASKYRGAEQITGIYAKCLLLQAGLPNEQASEPKKPLIVLDNACGTGMLSENLWEMLDEHAKEELQLVCGDTSEGMVKHVKKKIDEEGWHGADARVVDAMVHTASIDDFDERIERMLTRTIENGIARRAFHPRHHQLWHHAYARL